VNLFHPELHYNYINQISFRLNELIQNESLNKMISEKQQQVAYDLFSVEKNKYEWNDFLYSL